MFGTILGNLGEYSAESVGRVAMTEQPTFIVNVNPDSLDVVHDPARFSEECNVDDAKGRQRVDAKTAAALISSGEARLCAHCGRVGE